jgi:hypothetical protein
LGKIISDIFKNYRLTPELVTELFCPTPRSRENLNVNGAVEKFLEQKLYRKNTKKLTILYGDSTLSIVVEF